MHFRVLFLAVALLAAAAAVTATGVNKACTIKDPCNGKPTRMTVGRVYENFLCRDWYWVTRGCTLLLLCKHRDDCSLMRRVTPVRGTFTDTCGKTYYVTDDCDPGGGGVVSL
ncbi:hypothetical protein I4F81_003006 [Pyropia yezoensis]|uniref:Uncharacterized protein n=1 Tax=Pyropia yezoensis TaxID=2788 RepID=A0ACC3BR85_PYRYE|nr:hypothetical protein I4F81_003006 [Neopyropia yezoensis]